MELPMLDHMLREKAASSERRSRENLAVLYGDVSSLLVIFLAQETLKTLKCWL